MSETCAGVIIVLVTLLCRPHPVIPNFPSVYIYRSANVVYFSPAGWGLLHRRLLPGPLYQRPPNYTWVN